MILGTKKFSVTATGTTAAAATQGTPTTGSRIFVTDIAGSSDKAGAIIKVIEDTEGTPITKFQMQVGTPSAGYFSHSFSIPVQITKDKSASVEIDGTAVCKANIAGFITSH